MENKNDGVDIPDGHISLNKWTNITTTLYGKNIKHYIDGKLIINRDLSSSTNFKNNVNLYLGGSGIYKNEFIDLSQFRIFSIALEKDYIKYNLVRDNFPNVNCENEMIKPEFCYNKNITNRYLNDYYDKTDNIANRN